MTHITVTPGKLTLDALELANNNDVQLSLDENAISAIHESAATVRRVIASGRIIYGVNTGFGLLANTQIPADQLQELQRSIVLSHAAGVGRFMEDNCVRLLLLLKINSLARGFSGVRLEIIEALIALVNNHMYPLIPVQGSVGASGDLAPLAHMSAVLLGEGAVRVNGEVVDAVTALSQLNIAPFVLAPKEGLALLNGTQASTALALQGLFAAKNALVSAIVTGSLSVEAARGSRRPFDEKIHQVRGHQAQIDIAEAFRELLSNSEIADSHRDCEKVQDPYSLRCQPQVLGACLQQIRHAATILLTEANAVSDNPLVFSDCEDIISGGNFHAEPVAMAADNLALAIAEIGSIAERRIALLIDHQLSGLPPFLVNNGGVNSGFMIAQVTAAALASENKSLAHPASVDSIPTSANQEDHVSMATFAARRLMSMSENTTNILAIEYLAACQGLDFLEPLFTSKKLLRAKDALRQKVPFYDKDRYFSPDIEKASTLINTYVLQDLVSYKIWDNL